MKHMKPRCQCRVLRPEANSADPGPNETLACMDVATRYVEVKGQRILLCSAHFADRVIGEDGQVLKAVSKRRTP
jgi:hypothetical protein